MNSLPASIEQYLQEAGFSPTELLILAHLMQNDSLTLREIAAKTGKSTGVLDHAMKKLLRKKIVVKETINDVLRYTFGSLDAVQDWVERDMEEKRIALERRQQDFETFVSSLKLDKARPDMQYYDGIDGIMRAYIALLNCGTKELLHYQPLEDAKTDPLEDFAIQYFRERRHRGIFSRVIAQDTPQGRRYRSRDPFEYRETVLVDPTQYPIAFEKIIAGDTVACINHTTKRACLIRYPELGEVERGMFWAVYKKEKPGTGTRPAEEEISPTPQIALKTRFLSGFREFIMSRTSLVLFAIFGIVAFGLTFFIYKTNVQLNIDRLRSEQTELANIWTPFFTAEDLRHVNKQADTMTAEHNRIVYFLNFIQNENRNVYAASLLRPAADGMHWQFVADASSRDLYGRTDISDEEFSAIRTKHHFPGDRFSDAALDIPIPADLNDVKIDSRPENEGVRMTTWAPVRGTGGDLFAMLVLQSVGENVQYVNNQNFLPVYILIACFLMFTLARFYFFNRELVHEVLLHPKRDRVLGVLFCISLSLTVGTYGLYRYRLALLHRQIGERLMAIAVTAAPYFDGDEIEKIRVREDMKKKEYQAAFLSLNNIRNQNKEVKYAYIWRPTNTTGIWEFVIDADANFFIPDQIDFNHNNEPDSGDQNVHPGIQYDMRNCCKDYLAFGIKKPIYEQEFAVDQWGAQITASAPIQNRAGANIAAIAIDVDAEKFIEANWKEFSILVCLLGSISLILGTCKLKKLFSA